MIRQMMIVMIKYEMSRHVIKIVKSKKHIGLAKFL